MFFMTFTVPTNGRVLAGAGREEEEALTLSLKNIILKNEIHCLHCLISNTLFLWSNFMVLLQLLGRTVSDCPSLGVLPLWLQEIQWLPV